MIRPRPLMAAAATGAAALALVAVARADTLFAFGHADRSADQQAASHARLLAKAAFTQVLAHRADILGMAAPLNAQPYAPIYPDGLVLEETLSPQVATGGTVSYDAPADLRTTIDFYEDAAASQGLPFHVATVAPDTVEFTAGDGRRMVKARLTRQFAQSTVVDLSYR